MSDVVKPTLVILWEHEIRAAAKAMRAYYNASLEGSGVPERERGQLALAALNATLAALWHVEDAGSIVLTAAPMPIGGKRRRVEARNAKP